VICNTGCVTEGGKGRGVPSKATGSDALRGRQWLACRPWINEHAQCSESHLTPWVVFLGRAPCFNDSKIRAVEGNGRHTISHP
jgi:hypothetical protein